MIPRPRLAAWFVCAWLASQGQAAAPSTEVVRKASDLMSAGRFADAAQLLEPAAAQAGDDPQSGELQFLTGQAFYRLAQYDRTEQYWDRALRDERATGDRPHEARTLRALAQMRKNQGGYAEGLALAHQALDVYTSLGDARNAALTCIVIGAIDDLKGDYRGALASYDQASPVLAADTTAQAASLSYERGITLKNLGRYTEALDAYQRAYQIYTSLHDLTNQAVAIGNIGVLYEETGENERALQFDHQALELAHRSGEPRLEMLGLVNIAGAYWQIGDAAHALQALDEELAIARRIGARSEEAAALEDLGEIHRARHDAAAAARDFEQALTIRRAIGDQAGAASTLVALSDIALGHRDLGAAKRRSDEALALARTTERPEREWEALRASAAVATASGRRADAIDRLRESARIINAERSNIASDSGKIAFTDTRRLVFEQRALALLDDGRPADALEAAEAGRARAFADLLAQRKQTTSAEGTGRDHELASLQTAASPTIADVRATASRLQATLVEYLSADDRLVIWTVAPGGTLHSRVVNVRRAALDRLTRRVRGAIEAGSGASGLHAALRDLYRDLVAPVAAWLPSPADAPVIVIPHGPLLLVPFAALEDAKGQPFIVRHALASAPSASVFEFTAAKRRAAADHADRALVVADPVPPPDSRAARLPGARSEGERIATRFGAGSARLLTGAAATESAVKAEAPQYGVMHFAVHGVIVPERPLASSLLLGAGGGDDGYLRVDEIFGMTLAARLVVLSGCSTGLGQLTGDGIVGMTRAFLYAGTPTVLVSQWDVGDRATSALMDRFYAELLRGRTAAQALRSAVLATRARYPSPGDWAAFELVGEPQ